MALALTARASLAPRDVGSATRLDRLVWFDIGLETGYVLVGSVLAITGWRLSRNRALVGGGIGVIVQGGARAVLDLLPASQISR